MRKSSETTRLLGTPVVPPVSKTYHGLSLNPRGIHRFTGPPRSQSSSKNGNFLMSSQPLTSLSGLKSNVLALSSQNGVPVSGLKCQRTTSRTWASSCVLAFLILSSRVAPLTGAGLPGVSFTEAPGIAAREIVASGGQAGTTNSSIIELPADTDRAYSGGRRQQSRRKQTFVVLGFKKTSKPVAARENTLVAVQISRDRSETEQ